MNLRTLWSLVKESAVAWNQDYAASMGAALSYYTIFSIAPLLVIVIAVAGLVLAPKRPAARSSSRCAAWWATEARRRFRGW